MNKAFTICLLVFAGMTSIIAYLDSVLISDDVVNCSLATSDQSFIACEKAIKGWTFEMWFSIGITIIVSIMAVLSVFINRKKKEGGLKIEKLE